MFEKFFSQIAVLLYESVWKEMTIPSTNGENFQGESPLFQLVSFLRWKLRMFLREYGVVPISFLFSNWCLTFC